MIKELIKLISHGATSQIAAKVIILIEDNSIIYINSVD